MQASLPEICCKLEHYQFILPEQKSCLHCNFKTGLFNTAISEMPTTRDKVYFSFVEIDLIPDIAAYQDTFSD